MKLMIELSYDKRSFRILEQDTEHIDSVSPPIYEDETIALFQRSHPAFYDFYCDSQLRSAKMVLYLRGTDTDCDRDWVYIGNNMLEVLSHLRKAFSDFTIIGADKFSLGE